MKQTITKCKEKHPMSTLIAKKILSSTEAIAFFELSEDWFRVQRKKGMKYMVKPAIKYHKEVVEDWIMTNCM